MSPAKSDFRSYRLKLFRIVEAQHRLSSHRLVEDLAGQDILEALIDEVKPTMPKAAGGLHHLLATPFRYGFGKATRFRRAHERPGIFYASERQDTAVAETAYWRLRFFSASKGMKLPRNNLEHWAFSIPVDVTRALDLTREPFVARRADWTNSDNYEACQEFAVRARKIGAQLIRYESARDPKAGKNGALLDPTAFQAPVPHSEQTWHFRFAGNKLTAFAALPSDLRYDFTFEQFGLEPPLKR